jgi:hypothetical protein
VRLVDNADDEYNQYEYGQYKEQTVSLGGGAQLELRKPQYGAYLASLVFGLVGGTDDFAGRGPRVVAVSGGGHEYEVEQFRSVRSARRALAGMEEEVSRLGVTAWCKAHDLPVEPFQEGD